MTTLSINALNIHRVSKKQAKLFLL